MSKLLKKIAGIILIFLGGLLVTVMTIIVLEQKIKNPSFDLFSVSLLFLAPTLLIGVGYEMLDSSDKKEDDTK